MKTPPIAGTDWKHTVFAKRNKSGVVKWYARIGSVGNRKKVWFVQPTGYKDKETAEEAVKGLAVWALNRCLGGVIE